MQRLILCALLLAATVAQAQLPSATPSRVGLDPARLDVVHATTKRFVDDGKHAGIITLLARGGKIADVQARGYRDVEKKLPMERNTLRRIDSMSKIITSVGVLVLMEDGRFNLEDAVGAHLPELKDVKLVAIAFAQHFPYNQHNFFSKFTTGCFQALK